MKKISLALLILAVLAAAWLGASWYTGTHLQAQADDALTRINTHLANSKQLAALDIQIKQLSYQRGLLSSHARYATASNRLGQAPLGEIDITLSHGPFPLAALQSGNLMPQQARMHIEWLTPADSPLKKISDAIMNGKPPLVMDIGCSYGKHCTFTGGMPAIKADLGANAKLAFDGIQIRADVDYQSDTDYKTNGDVQLLPVSLGGQNFGSGQFTFNSDAQSATEVFSWKTDQGASKFTLALTTSRPLPIWGDPTITPETLPELIKTASAKLELSKPMLVDLAARALNLTKGIDLAAARQQMDAQIGTMLADMPAEMSKVIQTQNDLLVTDWQYSGGKLIINGQENPELLAKFKQGYLKALQGQGQAIELDEQPSDDSEAASGPQPDASDPEPAASE